MEGLFEKVQAVNAEEALVEKKKEKRGILRKVSDSGTAI